MSTPAPPNRDAPSVRASLGDGAQELAPTAPHATPGGATDDGASRFWRGSAVKRGFQLGIAVSILVHATFVPWRALWNAVDFDAKIVDGDLDIPAEFLVEPTVTEAPPEPAAAAPILPGPNAVDGGVSDAAADAGQDGGQDGGRDAGQDAGRDAGNGDSGLGPVAVEDAGPVDGGVAVAALPSTGAVPNLDLTVNGAVIKAHPVGPKVTALLGHLYPWNLMQGTGVDPIADTDAIRVWGPSFWLGQTQKMAVAIRYSMDDARADAAMDALAAKMPTPDGKPVEYPGVKSALVSFDKSDRVLLRGVGKTLVVVPPSEAKKFAAPMQKRAFDVPVKPNEAARLVVRHPHDQIAQAPETVQIVTLTIVVLNDKGDGELRVDAECLDGTGAADVAQTLNDLPSLYELGRLTNGSLPAGLLDGLAAKADGTHATATMPLSAGKVDQLFQLIDRELERAHKKH